MRKKYEKLDFALRGVLTGNGEDTGSFYPLSDVVDQNKGARWIPGEVTEARRRGEIIPFVQQCGACCWYWQFPDGSRIYHYDPLVRSWIARDNGKTPDEQDRYVGGVGNCPTCGNPFTRGGHISVEEIQCGRQK